MKLLVLKGFNNYFNRKIKKYSEIDDYIANSSLSYTFSDINFNPNDGIITEQVLGSENQKETGSPTPEPLNWEVDGSPDYIIAYTQETIDDTVVNTIHSRWFVLECVRTRLGQYKLALKRDTIADHLEAILTNPCFIEKGYVKHTDPLIFNEENVSLNQIKNYKGNHPEVMLKDQTGIPWLVLYLAQNAPKDSAKSVYGKQILDTQDALDYDELPWAGIESGANMSNTTQIRRIPGACEINISPIIAQYLNHVGVGRYIDSPVRYNYRCIYENGDWKKDNNTTNFTYIGRRTYIEGSWFSVPVYRDALCRGGINLTPASTALKWNLNEGGRVVTGWTDAQNAGGDGGTYNNYENVKKYFESISILETTNPFGHPLPENTFVKNYLTGKKNWLEANVSHSPVPGQSNMEAYVGGPQAFLPAATLMSYNNKLVTFDNINYYRIRIVRQNNYTRPIDYFTLENGNIVPSANNNLKSGIRWSAGSQGGRTIVAPNINTDNTMIETFFEHAWFDIQYEKVTADLLTSSIQPQGSTDRLSLNDCAYDMICLPYGAIDFKVTKGDSILSKTSSAEASIGIARAIAAELGSALYDMQLLPYCPWQAAVNDYVTNGFINITGTVSPGSQTLASGCWFGVYKISAPNETADRANTVSFGLWCPQSHGTFNITHTIEMPEENSEAYKVFNACKKFRLVAPNYSSIFEFNPLKNGGVTVFNVDYNYRPFNPYIHIAPTFDGLYGVDTNDNRGLILQGDFSVGYYSDKWAEYQIQNANYSNIFDRQLANIDSNQKLEREQTRTQYGWNIASEFMGLGGGLKGASAAPPGWGTLIGGIAGTVGGGVGSIIGSKLDERWMNWRLDEERSYAIDMYNLNLGNVKAQPYGLAKSDALTENFKFFPFIEEYDCTEKEVEIFKSKLKYDGMTVDAIGTIADYLPEGDYEFQKVKGRMIMIENIVDDFHVADDIYTEVNKGFYYVPNYVEPEGE